MKGKKTSRPPSKGELFIEDYLYESNISYTIEHKMEDLDGDKFSYRVADFYLTKLGFYVEYYGMYNKSEKHKAEYDYKSNIYIKNRRPTIFLYPEDLGILDYSFHTEVRRLFGYKIYHNKWAYLRYSINRYVLKGKPSYILVCFYFYIMGVILGGINIGLSPTFSSILSYSSYLMAVLFLWKFIRNFFNYVHLKEILGFVGLKNIKS